VSADLWLAAPPIPAAHRSPLKKLMTAVLNLVFDASQAATRLVRRRRRSRAWRQDLPSNIGLDHLAETGFPPFVPRGSWSFRPVGLARPRGVRIPGLVDVCGPA